MAYTIKITLKSDAKATTLHKILKKLSKLSHKIDTIMVANTAAAPSNSTIPSGPLKRAADTNGILKGILHDMVHRQPTGEKYESNINAHHNNAPAQGVYWGTTSSTACVTNNNTLTNATSKAERKKGCGSPACGIVIKPFPSSK